jgi:hypothetical protein
MQNAAGHPPDPRNPRLNAQSGQSLDQWQIAMRSEHAGVIGPDPIGRAAERTAHPGAIHFSPRRHRAHKVPDQTDKLVVRLQRLGRKIPRRPGAGRTTGAGGEDFRPRIFDRGYRGYRG